MSGLFGRAKVSDLEMVVKFLVEYFAGDELFESLRIRGHVTDHGDPVIHLIQTGPPIRVVGTIELPSAETISANGYGPTLEHIVAALRTAAAGVYSARPVVGLPREVVVGKWRRWSRAA